MSSPPGRDSGVRLAELMAALSMATDLGMGQPLETARCACVVAMRLGEALKLSSDTNMFRVKDGRVVEQWAELDMLGLLQQIGAIPPL